MECNSISKKLMPLFEQPMEELPKGMLILGRDDYEEVWHRTAKPAEEVGIS